MIISLQLLNSLELFKPFLQEENTKSLLLHWLAQSLGSVNVFVVLESSKHLDASQTTFNSSAQLLWINPMPVRNGLKTLISPCLQTNLTRAYQSLASPLRRHLFQIQGVRGLPYISRRILMCNPSI